MSLNKTEEILRFSNLRLKGIENVNVGEALCTLILGERGCIYSKKNIIKEFLSILFFRNYIIEKKARGHVLLVLSPSYGNRAMCKEDFIKVKKCLKSYISITSNNKFKINIDRLKLLILWVKWMKSFKELNMDFTMRFHYCNQLLLGVAISKEILDKLAQKEFNPNLIVTYCDVHVVDYFLTYYFNELNIPTATLQHALFSSECDTGWHCEFSHSKYFLAISKYSANEAIKSGVLKDRVLITGPMKYICSDKTTRRNNRERSLFGVALSGPVYEYQNKELLEFSLKISKTYNLDVLIRCHPAISIEKYNDYIDYERVYISEENEKMDEFADKCDFVIMGTTNVFADLISIGCPAYRYIKEKDFFSDIHSFKFENYSQLNMEIDDYINNRKVVDAKIKKIREYICPDNIKQNYIDFFNKYMKD